MGMRQKWLLFIVACIVFGVSLLAHLPAQLVVPEHIGKFQLLGIGGSLWHGEIQQVLYSGKALPIRNLNWAVSPATLFAGALEADLYEPQTPVNRGSLSLNLLSREIELHALHWQFSGEGSAIQGVATNSQPMLPGDSSFQCTMNSCRVGLNLRPTSDAPQSLLNVLLFMGLQQTGDTFSGQITLPLE